MRGSRTGGARYQAPAHESDGPALRLRLCHAPHPDCFAIRPLPAKSGERCTERGALCVHQQLLSDSPVGQSADLQHDNRWQMHHSDNLRRNTHFPCGLNDEPRFKSLREK
ncbi:hypothetical protein SSBR45G_56780 [Bradyrhizobium sp. SSBR45G]|nr:hypothetical protein SSBR45G_56780 [Bradyrhizobium sp. SSBR45G]GLH88193.1 hypothetical protein SSBR45R_56540 [Bradyrhizobium sp. SSBR45R]